MSRALRVVQVLVMFPFLLIAGVYLAITERGVTVHTRLSKMGDLIWILPAMMIGYVRGDKLK
jgi:hypothetical protein